MILRAPIAVQLGTGSRQKRRMRNLTPERLAPMTAATTGSRKRNRAKIRPTPSLCPSAALSACSVERELLRDTIWLRQRLAKLNWIGSGMARTAGGSF